MSRLDDIDKDTIEAEQKFRIVAEYEKEMIEI